MGSLDFSSQIIIRLIRLGSLTTAKTFGQVATITHRPSTRQIHPAWSHLFEGKMNASTAFLAVHSLCKKTLTKKDDPCKHRNHRFRSAKHAYFGQDLQDGD